MCYVNLIVLVDRVRRWLQAHPRVQAYVGREEYRKIMELASNMNMSVSELVRRAVLDLEGLRDEVYESGFRDGYRSALSEVRDVCERLGTYEVFGIEEFTAPCSRCGKPMVFTSRSKEFWEKRVKPILLEKFSHWVHRECKEGSASTTL